LAAPPVYRPNQVNAPTAQLKPANHFRLETRSAPPVYRPQQAQSRMQPKSANNFSLELRPAPPVYRPQQAGPPAAQEKPLAGTRMLTGQQEFRNAGYTQRENPAIVNRAVQPKLAISSPMPVINLAARHSVVQRMDLDEDDLVDRLVRSHNRNLSEKSEPVKERSIFDLQSSSSYGFQNNVINEDILKGSFRKGWGSQPFLSLNKDDFGGAVVKSDYDSIIAVFQKDSHQEGTIAEDILVRIDHGTVPKGYSDETLRAMSTLIQLTQVIESHDSRVPGVDKYARASLTRILNGESTFHLEFNRKNGNYLPARAKSGGSKFGGQEAILAVVGKSKKSHKAKRKDVLSPGVLATLAEMSDSSGDEDSDEDMSDDDSAQVS
jgi:hypothetical protein